MDSTNQPTCGQGLAANATLPARFAEVLAARAEVLERHTRALDLTDPNGQRELEAYTALVRAHRAVAAELANLAQAMASYRDLPMAAHDRATMTDPSGQSEAFRRFVAVEQELLALLGTNVAQEHALLQH